MNHLEGYTQLENTYFVLRHGNSKSNEQKEIHSIKYKNEYGLSLKGREEVQSSIDTAILEGKLTFSEPIIIFSSFFMRAEETAKIAQRSIPSSGLILHAGLAERNFGQFEGGSVLNYKTVWENDKKSITERPYQVESVSQVLDRTTKLIDEVEKGKYAKTKGDGKTVLLVSHGDPLQILQTAFEGIHPSQHRSLPLLGTGEIRELEWKNH